MINDLISKVAALQKGYEKFLFEHFQNLMSVCNSDQKIKLKEIFMTSLTPGNRPPKPTGQRPGMRPPPGRPPR